MSRIVSAHAFLSRRPPAARTVSLRRDVASCAFCGLLLAGSLTGVMVVCALLSLARLI